MSALLLRNRCQGNITQVENEFIDHYMPSANGEYVKIYLLLLRSLNEPGASLSISQIADMLGDTEGDVLRALKYWEAKGLMILERDERGHVVGVEIGRVPKARNAEPEVQITAITPESPKDISETAPAAAKSAPSGKTARAKADRKGLKQCLFIAERYLGKTLTSTETQTITSFYDTLHFSTDLIEYLIEYCVENGHKSIHYIQKVALSWSDSGVSTVDQAKELSAAYNKPTYLILNAYGIKGRAPAAAEMDFITRWTETEHYDLDLILDAVGRTMLKTHQPSFEYTDKILKNWKAAGVATVEEAAAQDAARGAAPKPSSSAKSSASGSKFRGIEEHSYDEDLYKQLLNNT